MLLLFSNDTFSMSDFSAIFEKHSAVMLIIEPKTGNILQANSAAQHFYGFAEKKLESLAIQDINLLSVEQVASERALAKSEDRNYFIFRHQTSNGDIKTVSSHSIPITYNNKAVLFSIIQDVTSEREYQQALWHYQSNLENLVDKQVNEIDKTKKNLIQLLVIGLLLLSTLSLFLLFMLKRKNEAEAQRSLIAQIVEQSPVSIQTTDLNGIITYVNKEFVKSSGFQATEVIGQKTNILKSGFHQSPLYENLWATITSGKHWIGEFYNQRKNGDNFWEKANVYPLKDAKNRITSYVGIKEDITQIKQDEKQLRLASTVFKTATEAVMVTDIDNNIVAVNQAFILITGYEEKEVLGKNPTLLSSGHHDTEFYQRMAADLESLGQWQGEICNRRKNGEVFYEWLSVTALRDEFGQLESYVSLFSDITKRKKAEDKIYRQANYDSLTGLANRNLFVDRFEHTLELAQRDNNRVAIFFIDLDGFKNVNDTFGHAKGDMLLKLTTERIKESVRKADTVSRLSGDEFAIILSGDNDVFSFEKIASQILDKIAKPFHLIEIEAYVTASIGISIFPDDGSTYEELLSKADSAMYKAKEKGKNNVQFFTKEMDIKAQQRRHLEVELRKVIVNKELILHYQPIHQVSSNKVVSAEALVRWLHPIKGLVPPADFIALAEDIGFITEIGDWVLEEACKQAKCWQSQFDLAPKISVNISSVQFQRQDFISKLETILAKTQLAPDSLILEMTESLLIQQDDQTLIQLSAIRAMGIELSIDDFGTGYSSLSYLKRFPISILKIDRAFIKDITFNAEDEALACAILSMAKSLGLKVVAEGVEDLAQCQLLTKHQCDYIQGYFFSRPLEEHAFIAYLNDNI
ncbi:EAL domain-containing protein [Colwellia sp. BRX10-6]|uniref:EAL domain-containing protein n=1 Tax=unclassified Colwellia TaxID=196834 RepID=UPI0015F4F3D9|nr:MULTISPECIES: EAL domain-containing protein [unclassified Colwellia]MBA6382996.1 EAL domain-containing protein [Colwellia sp. BRX10-9]MBA6394553.1 EAL domain-containing protein [Colwellia sp. BRX10-6]